MKPLKYDINYKAGAAYGWFRKKFAHLPIEDAEDFRAYCVESWLSSRKINTFYKFMAVDFFREHGAQTCIKRPSGDAMAKTRRIHKDDHEDRDTQDTSERLFIGSDTFDAIIKELDLTTKILTVMHFRYGYKYEDLAALFEITPSRVTQIMRKVLKDLQQKAKSI